MQLLGAPDEQVPSTQTLSPSQSIVPMHSTQHSEIQYGLSLPHLLLSPPVHLVPQGGAQVPPRQTSPLLQSPSPLHSTQAQ